MPSIWEEGDPGTGGQEYSQAARAAWPAVEEAACAERGFAGIVAKVLTPRRLSAGSDRGDRARVATQTTKQQCTPVRSPWRVGA